MDGSVVGKRLLAEVKSKRVLEPVGPVREPSHALMIAKDQHAVRVTFRSRSCKILVRHVLTALLVALAWPNLSNTP